MQQLAEILVDITIHRQLLRRISRIAQGRRKIGKGRWARPEAGDALPDGASKADAMRFRGDIRWR